MSLKNNYLIEFQKKIENKVQPMLRIVPNFVSPNMLSFGNFIFMITGSTFFYFQMYIFSLFSLVIAFSLDNLDGMLARYKNEDNINGYYIDGSFDRLGDIFWFIALYLAFPSLDFQILLLAISAFLINYYRSQQLMIFNINKSGLFDKKERNLLFLGFLILLIINADLGFLILIVNVVTILSILTLIQLVIRGLRFSRSTPISDILDKLEYKLGGT
jgi:phosphatidylglycerophosphate synthase